MFDLYTTQPLSLKHPALVMAGIDSKIPIAAVCKVADGVVIWNADKLAEVYQPEGVPGSGFPAVYIQAEPEFIDGAWHVKDVKDNGRIMDYVFTEPPDDMLESWNEVKSFLPNLEELQEMALQEV